MIIAAFAGTGKTSLAKMHPQKAADFVSMPFKYYLPEAGDSASQPDGEACKADYNNMMREDWPDNYVAAIINSMRDGKILLIPSAWDVLERLKEKNAPYYLCYPRRDAKEEYKKRFQDRGNTEDFIDIFIGGWDRFMDTLEADTYGRHIVMTPHLYLSDVIDIDMIYARGW